jgi:response regulator RpfG family c-di-GMP phosphodiesterase
VQGWIVWVLVGIAAWLVVSIAVGSILGRILALNERGLLPVRDEKGNDGVITPVRAVTLASPYEPRLRVMVVDDDPHLRLLLTTTLGSEEFAVQEAASAEAAVELARFFRPRVVVADLGLPGQDGLWLSRQLKRQDAEVAVIVLTGADTSAEEVERAGADGLLRKPFSPVELLDALDVKSGRWSPPAEASEPDGGDAQLLEYARDLSHLVTVERSQRRLLQQAYLQTVSALADALEVKDPVTGSHAERVQRYALELSRSVDDTLLLDQSLRYGYLLHDIGKIAVPEPILNKRGTLTPDEVALMRRHPVVGAEMLQDVALLQGGGLDVVRSHHERWDGAGYPDHLSREEIPIGARVFAVADALDAMTSDRPYRKARPWGEALSEIIICGGTQFDPTVVAALAARESDLYAMRESFAAAVA